MAMDEKNEEYKGMTIRKDGEYQVATFLETGGALFQKIRDKFGVEPALGEIMLIRGRVYFTAVGCSRLAENKHVKDIRFEYLDPTISPIYQIRLHPELYIVVKCTLTKEDNGIVEGHRALNLEEEKHWQWGVCCWEKEGNKSFPAKLYWADQSAHTKTCSKCSKILKGYDGWKLKDYMNFAETKAFMRAVGKAYNVELFDDLPDEMRMDAQDVATTKDSKHKSISKQEVVQQTTKPSSKVDLPTIDAKPPPLSIDQATETKIIKLDPIEEDIPENPFEEDAKQLTSSQSEYVMTVDDFLKEAIHLNLTINGKAQDAIQLNVGKISIFDMVETAKAYKIISPSGNVIFLPKSQVEYNSTENYLNVPTWLFTMGDNKAKWQEMFRPKKV